MTSPITLAAEAAHDAYNVAADDQVDPWPAVVRAVLESVREPTQAMAEAAYDHPNAEAAPWALSPEDTWRTMLDHLLSTPKEQKA